MARYSELEQKHTQVELSLKLVQEKLTKAKEETEGMFGESLDCFCSSFASNSDLAVTLQAK